MSSKNYNIIKEAREGIRGYINFYNNKRPHESLNYKTPMSVYMAGLNRVAHQMKNKQLKTYEVATIFSLFCMSSMTLAVNGNISILDATYEVAHQDSLHNLITKKVKTATREKS